MSRKNAHINLKINKKTNQNTRQWVNKLKHDKWLPVLALILLFASPFAFNQIRTYFEKRTYANAEKEIVSLVNKAKKLAPSESKINKYCERSSAKYEDGDLSCSIIGVVNFAATSEDNISSLIKSLDSIQHELSWEYTKDNTWNYTGEKTEIKNQRYKYKNLSCGVTYRYKINSSREIVLTDSGRSLVVVMSCGGSAMREYF